MGFYLKKEQNSREKIRKMMQQQRRWPSLTFEYKGKQTKFMTNCTDPNQRKYHLCQEMVD